MSFHHAENNNIGTPATAVNSPRTCKRELPLEPGIIHIDKDLKQIRRQATARAIQGLNPKNR